MPLVGVAATRNVGIGDATLVDAFAFALTDKVLTNLG